MWGHICSIGYGYASTPLFSPKSELDLSRMLVDTVQIAHKGYSRSPTWRQQQQALFSSTATLFLIFPRPLFCLKSKQDLSLSCRYREQITHESSSASPTWPSLKLYRMQILGKLGQARKVLSQPTALYCAFAFPLVTVLHLTQLYKPYFPLSHTIVIAKLFFSFFFTHAS